MEFQGNHPIYQQIADLICEKIIVGQWQPEKKISSVREMAVQVEVNPNTVMRAYSYLQTEGIIFNKRGIGYFVDENAPEKIRELKKESFIQQDLPNFFKTIELLQIPIDELKQYYLEYKEGLETRE